MSKLIIICLSSLLGLMTLSGCSITLSVFGALFPNNKTIQDADETYMEIHEAVFPPDERDCVVNYMTMCFSNDTTHTIKRIRTDGFYYYQKNTEPVAFNEVLHKTDSENPWGREIYRTAFYSDGLFGGNIWMDDGDIGAGEWGIYEISNDTLIIECMTRGSMNATTYGFRDTLIVKSQDTLILLSRTPICPELSNHENYFYYYKGERGDELYFMSFDSLPNPEKAWIKRKKWFWCDEDEWKQYRKELKKRY